MARRKRWPNNAETQRIEAIAIFGRIVDDSDSIFDAIESGRLEKAVGILAAMKGRAAKGRYMLQTLPNMDDDEDLDV